MSFFAVPLTHLVTRAGTWAATTTGGRAVSKIFGNPFVQSGQFGLGYTASAYAGYGITNTADPFGIHKPKYKSKQQSLGLPGYYGSYGRRRYRRRYRRYSRYSGYRRYSRRPYYRRGYY